MTELTQEQTEEFWRRCGAKFIPAKFDNCYDSWLFPDGRSFIVSAIYPVPPFDLNNLFRYAVPRLLEQKHTLTLVAIPGYFFVELQQAIGHPISYLKKSFKDKDPAIALSWAIWEVIQQRPTRPEMAGHTESDWHGR